MNEENEQMKKFHSLFGIGVYRVSCENLHFFRHMRNVQFSLNSFYGKAILKFKYLLTFSNPLCTRCCLPYATRESNRMNKEKAGMENIAGKKENEEEKKTTNF